MQKIRVLSLCDGISCGYMALKKIGAEFEYWAIEFDKFARQTSEHNFKDIVRPCNDVNEITARQMLLGWPVFDLVTFGSPCQSVSLAGKGDGLDGSSGLLFKCMEILAMAKYRNPDLKFLIENVKMKKEFLDQFNQIIGCKPTLINSSKLSAQNRERYYWTGKEISQPEDANLLIKDIIEDDFFTEKEKSYCIDACYHKGTDADRYLSRRQIVFKYSESNRYEREDGSKTQIASEAARRTVERRMIESDKSLTLTTGEGCGSGMKSINLVLNNRKSQTVLSTIHKENEKSMLKRNKMGLLTQHKDGDFLSYRKLTVRECARLQTIPDSFKFPVSKTQAYRQIGNGWTVEVIAHILKELGF